MKCTLQIYTIFILSFVNKLQIRLGEINPTTVCNKHWQKSNWHPNETNIKHKATQ